MSDLLASLLSKPLARGMRCDGCKHWLPEWPDNDPELDVIGECVAQDERETTSAHDGCVYWSPVLGNGLDYMGIPLASPLADSEGTL